MFFFLFRVVFNNFFTILLDIENARLKLALATPTGTPMAVPSDAIEMLPLVPDKAIINIYQNNQKSDISLLLINPISIISQMK